MSEPLPGDGATPPRDLVVAHSSDLHIGWRDAADPGLLAAVIEAARDNGAQLLVLAGDVFDHNRLPLPLLDRVARSFGDSGLPIAILPGNHDCLGPDSVYRRGGISEPANVYVLGVTADEELAFPALDLGLWGRPHRDYADMSPLKDAPGRKQRWNIAVAHGHWHTSTKDAHRAWLIHNEEIAAVDADYIALGHWDRAIPVGDGSRPAYYSGSPDLAQTINVVRFSDCGTVTVERAPLTDFDSDDVPA